jgi:hypothetical protein
MTCMCNFNGMHACMLHVPAHLISSFCDTFKISWTQIMYVLSSSHVNLQHVPRCRIRDTLNRYLTTT